MNFRHQNTFLRSALVKDPFSLGDLGPEDVLRIESQFPNLFDTAVNVTLDHPTNLKKPALKVPLTGIKLGTSTAIHKCCDCINGKRPAAIKAVTQGPRRPLQVTSKPLPKVQPAPPRPATPKTIVSPVPAVGNQQQRSGQLLSVGDLKRVLEEVLWQKYKTTNSDNVVVSKTITQGPRKPMPLISKSFSKVKPPPKTVVTSLEARRRLGLGKLLSGGDLIRASKEILGRKEINDQLSDPVINKTVTLVPPSSKPPPLPKASSIKSKSKQEKSSPKKVTIVMNGGHLSRPLISVTDLKRDSKDALLRKHKYNHSLDAGKHKTVTPDRPKELACKLSSKSTRTVVTPVDAMRSSSVQLLSISGRKPVSEKMLKDSHDEQLDDVASSYKQLQLARNLATKYEKIGLLKKMKFKQDLMKESRKPVVYSHKETTQKCITENPPSALSPAIESVIKKTAPTSNVLEKLAKELVYVEVLKHLHELQVKQKEELDDEEDLNSNDEVKLNKYESTVKVQPAERLAFSLESNNGRLATPELTPSNSHTQGHLTNNDQTLSKSCSYDFPTPDLTPSVRVKMGLHDANLSNANNNDNTDCSEVSDFIFSEKELKTTPKTFNRSSHRVKSESIIITTPRSTTSNGFAHRSHRKGIMDESPLGLVDTPDTLDVTSDFDHSSPAVIKNNLDTTANTTASPSKLSKYLSSVTEELSGAGISKSETGMPKSELWKSETAKSHLQKSQSEMLSEGEFIGNVYKSPGEVSISQPLSPYFRSATTGSTASTLISDAVQRFSQQVYPDVSTGEYL